MNMTKRKLIASSLAVAFCACVLSGPAQAQDTAGGSTAGTTGTTGSTTTTDDNRTDYGWLGLLGLAGLAGLMKKPQQTVVHENRNPPTGVR
jgi:opacity protein-like surface antigen